MSGWDSRVILPDILRVRVLVALVSVLTLLALAFVLCGDGEAELQESNVGLYLWGKNDFSYEFVDADGDGRTHFNLSLENHNASDAGDRYVLLWVEAEVRVGEEANWYFTFMNPLGGVNVANFSYKDVGCYRYLVKGDGTPTRVEIELDHYFTKLQDNQDSIRFWLWGYDFEAGSEPEDDENRTRFLEDMVDEYWSTPSNLTYLLWNRTYIPDLGPEKDDPRGEISLSSSIICDCYQPRVYAPSAITVVPGITYNLSVTVVNEAAISDRITFETEMDDGPTDPFLGSMRASNYVYGDKISLRSSESKTIYLEITAPVNRSEVPEGEYDLILTVKSADSGMIDEYVVTVIVPKRYEPLVQVVGEDDKNAATDGSFTEYDLRLKNLGALNDSFDMFVEVQDTTNYRAAGGTDDYWTKEFSPDPVFVKAGEFVDFTLNLTPLLDNEKIPPGKYPVRIRATSQKNTARFSETEVIIRMPNLYGLDRVLDSVPSTVRVGLEGDIFFTLTNNGVVEDRVELEFIFWHGDTDTMISSEDPAGWSFSFEDAETGELLEGDSVLLGTTPETKSLQIRLRFVSPVDALVGDYEVTMVAKSSGPPGSVDLDPWGQPPSFELLPPELFINPGDIEFSNPEPREGELVTINATVHLAGAVDRLIDVWVYHVTENQEELITTARLDFRGQAGEDLTRTVTVHWEATSLRGAGEFIEVRVDPNDVLFEEEESNNLAQSQITVLEDDEASTNWLPLAAGLAALGLLAGAVVFLFLGAFLLPEKNTKEVPGPQIETAPGLEPMKLALNDPEMDRLLQELRIRKGELETKLAENPKSEQSSQLEAVNASLERLECLKAAQDMIPKLTTMLFRELEGGGEGA